MVCFELVEQLFCSELEQQAEWKKWLFQPRFDNERGFAKTFSTYHSWPSRSGIQQ